MNENPIHRLNIISATLATLAAVCFSSNDVGIKFLSGVYALHQVVFFRTIIGITFILIFILPFNGGWHVLSTNRLFAHICRGLSVVFANLCFFLALASMPIADAVAILFVNPLLVTVFSIIFLDENVCLHRWFATCTGLIGIFIILCPVTSAFQFVSVLPLLAALGYATLHTLTRKIAPTESAATLAIYIQLTFLVVCILAWIFMGDGRYNGSYGTSHMFLFRSWVWPQISDFGIFFIIGIGCALGGFLISQAYRISEAAFVAPFEYIAMPLAILWGLIFFNEWPNLTSFCGIALVIGSGILVLWGENSKNAYVTPPKS